jgi:hypothetical protein
MADHQNVTAGFQPVDDFGLVGANSNWHSGK